MTMQEALKLFGNSRIRTAWDDEKEEWFFSVVDICGALTESKDPAAYWRKLKQRLKAEGNETVTNCHGLKMRASDGRLRLTDVVNTEQAFRLIQSIPSKKAEPFKQWMAMVAKERIDAIQNPELSIQQAVNDYRRLGYSESWINQRIKSIEIRKALTDEWKRSGMSEGRDFALLTDIITKEWSSLTTKEYKRLKGLKKESLRDNMTNVEIALNSLAEASATELSKQRSPKGFRENSKTAKDGGSVAKAARKKLESQLGRKVVTSEKASDYLPPAQDIEAIEEKE